MALQDIEQYELDKEDGLILERPAVVLLRHIHEIWPASTAFIPSLEIVDLLIDNFPQV